MRIVNSGRGRGQRPYPTVADPLAPSLGRPQEQDHARVDRWLWAARFFKTRALAAAAIAGGRVQVNGAKVKRARTLHVGDLVRLRLGPYEHLVTVRALSVHRGSAAVAATLYQEDPAARAQRLALAEQHRLANQSFTRGEGKPSKKQRRDLVRFKRGE